MVARGSWKGWAGDVWLWSGAPGVELTPIPFVVAAPVNWFVPALAIIVVGGAVAIVVVRAAQSRPITGAEAFGEEFPLSDHALFEEELISDGERITWILADQPASLKDEERVAVIEDGN